MSKTIHTDIPLNSILRPQLTSLQASKEALTRITTSHDKCKSPTTATTTRQMFFRHKGIVQTLTGTSVYDARTPPSKTAGGTARTDSAETVGEFSLFERWQIGMEMDLAGELRFLFGVCVDAGGLHHWGLGSVAFSGDGRLRDVAPRDGWWRGIGWVRVYRLHWMLRRYRLHSFSRVSHCYLRSCPCLLRGSVKVRNIPDKGPSGSYISPSLIPRFYIGFPETRTHPSIGLVVC